MPRLFVNRLTIMDFSYLDPEWGLVGESWLMDLEMAGTLDEQGMVLDFGRIKKQIKGLIDEAFDHRLLLPTGYAGCQLQTQGDSVTVQFRCQDGARVTQRSPSIALCPLPLERIEPEGVALCIRERLLPVLPDNVSELALRLYPESIEGAFYQYSHGLRHHDGNCRRIAHGHRSRLLIERNGQIDAELARDWAAGWRHAYLADRAVLLDRSRQEGVDYACFGYDTCEGRYELELPEQRCVLLDSDTTVEQIARHILEQLVRRYPAERFRVRAFEGVEKGALASTD